MSDVLQHVESGVMTLTLNRVDKKNSFTAAMYAMLADALTAAATDNAVRVVLFQGHETVFSAGNDIGDFLNKPPSTPDSPVFRFLNAIATFPKPLLAAVCGPAVGIGTTLLLHCDLVYAGDNAMFSMPFVNLGICPEAASTLLVPRLMGHQRAAEVLLMGDPFMAEAALEVGLVNRVVPPTEVTALAQQQARRLATKPLSSVIETKRLLKSSLTPAVLERMREEGAIFGRMLQEPAAKEAFSAFLEKRKPDFTSL
jgi:enoyl-CoA hydratase/carnithine racemase